MAIPAAFKFSPLPVSCEIPQPIAGGMRCVHQFTLGCVYPADVVICPPPTPVPVDNEVTLALMVTAVIVIAIAAIRRKP